jgi:transglutaminase-like putative cysteine protease/predicted glutamine amidotransferase
MSIPPLPTTPEELRREHRKTRLLALCLDGAASPSITLRALAEQDERDQPYGWGFAWYPEAAQAALVVKDPSSIGDNAMSKVLRQWERFESTIFVCHLRGAARTLREQDTHPFARSFAGRDWVFAHNGDLDGDLKTLLPIGEDGALDPIGGTDSERAFVWILEQVRTRGARRLSDVGWEVLHGWLRQLDGLGTANVLLTDGTDLVAYHDEERYNGLFLARLVPPHEPRLRAEDIEVDLDDAGDRTRTVLALSTVPLEGADWTPLEGGQMIVARRGALVFDSHRSEAHPASVPPPGPATPRMPAPPRAPREAATQQAARNASESPAPTTPEASAPTTPKASAAPLVLAPRRTPPGSRVLSVVHDTLYRYQRPVERSSHLYRLAPVHDPMQERLEHELVISSKGLRYDYQDVFGNATTRTEVETPYTELRVLSRSLVRSSPPSVHDLFSPERRLTLPLVWMPWQRQMMLPYLLPPELPETQLAELYEYALTFAERQDHDLGRTLLDINRTIYRDFAYVSGSTTLATTPFDVYANRKGVCQDFANLFICLARLLSIPARYRVGYIYTGANYENKVQSEASHAWAELYLPWRGWVGFDPTNGCLAGLDHVRVACGRNYRDATPTSGTIYKGGGFETLSVDVQVTALD